MVSTLRRAGPGTRYRDPPVGSRALRWRPTTLLLTVRRYRCAGCAHVWRQDSSKATGAAGQALPAWDAVALEAVVCQHHHRPCR